MAQPIRFSAIVEHVRYHTPNVATYRLRASKRLPRFNPGQFIHLTLEQFDPTNFWPESRVFSVANAVADRRTVELTISRQGVYTSKILDELKEGDQVWAKGPYGEFTINAVHGYQHTVLIAGGTGITPFCAFMDATLREGVLPVDKVTLHYGAQTPRLLIYRDLIERCAEQLSGFKAYYYAEQDLDKSDMPIRSGRINLDRIMADNKRPEATAFYISGPRAMIQTFYKQLVSRHDLSPEQVFVDAWE